MPSRSKGGVSSRAGDGGATGPRVTFDLFLAPARVLKRLAHYGLRDFALIGGLAIEAHFQHAVPQ